METIQLSFELAFEQNRRTEQAGGVARAMTRRGEHKVWDKYDTNCKVRERMCVRGGEIGTARDTNKQTNTAQHTQHTQTRPSASLQVLAQFGSVGIEIGWARSFVRSFVRSFLFSVDIIHPTALSSLALLCSAPPFPYL